MIVTHSTKTKSWNKAIVEEAIMQKSYGWYSVDYGKDIVELKRTVSGSVVGL